MPPAVPHFMPSPWSCKLGPLLLPDSPQRCNKHLGGVDDLQSTLHEIYPEADCRVSGRADRHREGCRRAPAGPPQHAFGRELPPDVHGRARGQSHGLVSPCTLRRGSGADELPAAAVLPRQDLHLPEPLGHTHTHPPFTKDGHVSHAAACRRAYAQLLGQGGRRYLYSSRLKSPCHFLCDAGPAEEFLGLSRDPQAELRGRGGDLRTGLHCNVLAHAGCPLYNN